MMNHNAIHGGKILCVSGLLAAGIATAGIGVGAGTANAQCVTASNAAVVDCDGIQHGQLSGETHSHVDGHGWAPGQGVEDLLSTEDYFRNSDAGEVRGLCMGHRASPNSRHQKGWPPCTSNLTVHRVV